jgi:hypothetical protein
MWLSLGGFVIKAFSAPMVVAAKPYAHQQLTCGSNMFYFWCRFSFARISEPG